MKRLFVAIKIIPQKELLKAFRDIQKRCFAGKIKWVDPDLFHLTLKFLGDTPEDKIEPVSEVLEEVTEETAGFSFDLAGLGIFGSSYRPRIIRVNVEKGGQLEILGNELLNRFDDVGFKRDRQNFVPHLTLGRIKQVSDKKLLQKTVSDYGSVFFQTVRVKTVILYESILHSSGPEYIILKEYKLR